MASWRQKKVRIQVGTRVVGKAAKWGDLEGTVTEAAGKNEWLIEWDREEEDRNGKSWKAQELKKVERILEPDTENGRNGSRTPPSSTNEEETANDENEQKADDDESQFLGYSSGGDGASSVASTGTGDTDEDEDELSESDGDSSSEDGGASVCVDEGGEDTEDKYEIYENEKLDLLGDILEVEIKSKQKVYRWVIVDDVFPEQPLDKTSDF